MKRGIGFHLSCRFSKFIRSDGSDGKKLAQSKKINVVLEKQLEKDALFHAFLSNFENHTTLFEICNFITKTFEVGK